MYVTNSFANAIGLYITSGQTVDGALIAGLDDPRGIAIVSGVSSVPVSEPSTLALLAVGLAQLGWGVRRRKRAS